MDIHVAGGTATGPTPMAAYDAALADAGVHNYNLVRLSSVVPADATVRVVDRAPDLGPAGNRLSVVEAAEKTTGPGRASAALGWAESEQGPGLFYEAAGESAEAVERRVRDGLAAGRDLREWTFPGDAEVLSTTVSAPDGTHAAAVVVAAFGASHPVA